jgi:phosphonatase-like hydrolase
MIELVVFDMAGTTVHDGNAVADCFRAALAAVGVHPETGAINAVMGLPKPEAIRRLLSAAGRSLNAAEVEAIHADFVGRMNRYYATDPSVREIAGASAVFAELRAAGIKIALNTGFSRGIVDVILRRLGWTKAVDGSIASDESPRGRPHPDMIHILMGKVGVQDPKRVAKVGDTPVDLAEGFAAGCGVVIGVTTGAFTRKELEAQRHTHVLDSVIEVPALLSKR